MPYVTLPVQTETCAADPIFSPLFDIILEICECAHDWGMWEVSFKLEETLDCILSENCRRRNGTYMFKSVRYRSIDCQSASAKALNRAQTAVAATGFESALKSGVIALGVSGCLPEKKQ